MAADVPPHLKPFMVTTQLGPVLPVDDRLPDHIMKLPAAEQAAVVDAAQRFIADVRANGTTPAYLAPFGAGGAGAPFAQVRAAIIDHFCWNLAKIMRYAEPTRIADAVPYLESVLAHYAKNNTTGPAKDITPMLYLAVALSRQPGKEDDALRVFMDASEGDPMGSNSRTLLWARANMARMLRRTGKDKLAQEQEDMVVNWMLGHPYGMPPTEFVGLVSDSSSEEPNYILEDAHIQKWLGSSRDLGNGMVVHFG